MAGNLEGSALKLPEFIAWFSRTAVKTAISRKDNRRPAKPHPPLGSLSSVALSCG